MVTTTEYRWCKTVSYYLKNVDTQYILDGNTTYNFKKMGNSINDLGVIFDNNLTFKDHMAQKINKAYSIVGIIKNFIYMDEFSFILLYKSMVGPHLEYANSVWCPYKQGDIKELEKIQKSATKLEINLKEIPYKDRLIHLKFQQ